MIKLSQKIFREAAMKNKILLSAVNAKFIHSNLAVRYLQKYCEPFVAGISIAEFSINDNTGSILKRLYKSGAGIFGFSCYIWNIGMILDICSSLRKILPDCIIILGGPEVSYDPAALLDENKAVDFIVTGEGEQTLLELLQHITTGQNALGQIPGIAYRCGAKTVTNPYRPLIASLDEIPFPYESFDDLGNKIVYYETSRGCPFNCQYCLSSTIHGVRYLSMERIRQDIASFSKAGIKQVKLVDRTFNCNINRSVEIMQYIIELNPAMNFHMEIAADLINEQFLATVKKAPAGMFQFEIGVQSTNPRTLSEIKRVMDFEKVSYYVRQLLDCGNAHLHLDLIAGLPYEDMESFKKSFNDVYSLKPDMLQLGFLKLLKGSGIRERSSDYGIEYHASPPYEVLSTNWLSYGEMLELKDIEHLLELYGNSGRFRHTLGFLLKSLEVSPFDFYRLLAGYWNRTGCFDASRGINELYNIMKGFAEEELFHGQSSYMLRLLNEYLKLDWLLYSRTGSMPDSINRYDHSGIKAELQSYLKNNIASISGFEMFCGLTARELLKYVGYEVLSMDVFAPEPAEMDTVVFYSLKQDISDRKQLFASLPLSSVLEGQHPGTSKHRLASLI
jgi:radical SAM superfamily enzyme YgiQ (UPF0313 family)